MLVTNYFENTFDVCELAPIRERVQTHSLRKNEQRGCYKIFSQCKI